MRSCSVPNLYSPKRRVLSTRKIGTTQLVWVEPKLGDQLGFQIQTADEDWSVEIEDEKCVQDILRCAKDGKQISSITHFNEEGRPTHYSHFPLPARLVRFNLDHLGTASAALLLVVCGQSLRVHWDKVWLTDMRDRLMHDPEDSPRGHWSVIRYILRPRK